MKFYFVLLLFLLAGCGPEPEKIYQSVQRGRIPQGLSIHFVEEIEVQAPPNKVWKLLSDMEHWSRWMPDAKQVKLKGPFAEGTEFELIQPDMRIQSKLAIIEENHLLGWTGKTVSFSGNFSLAQTAVIWKLRENNGRTTVTVEESLDGVWISIFVGKARLSSDLKSRLLQLKFVAEM